jgi:hypothetical protein
MKFHIEKLRTRTVNCNVFRVLSGNWCALCVGMVWYGMVWYGMVWYGMVWYGMVWYGIWYGKV